MDILDVAKHCLKDEAQAILDLLPHIGAGARFRRQRRIIKPFQIITRLKVIFL